MLRIILQFFASVYWVVASFSLIKIDYDTYKEYGGKIDKLLFYSVLVCFGISFVIAIFLSSVYGDLHDIENETIKTYETVLHREERKLNKNVNIKFKGGYKYDWNNIDLFLVNNSL